MAQSDLIRSQLDYITRNVVSVMWQSPASWPFQKPVDLIKLGIPNYPHIVKKPMDLGTIKTRLHHGQYSTAADCINDLQLMLCNCYIFNPCGDKVVRMALVLDRLMRKQLREIPGGYPVYGQRVVSETGWSSNATSPTSECSQLDEAALKRVWQGGSNILSNPPAKKHKAHVSPPTVVATSEAEQTEANRRAKRLPKSLKLCGSLLKELMAKRNIHLNEPFLEPVNVVRYKLTDYHTIIKQPMDLGTVKRKLEEGVYSCKTELAADVRLIFSNCYVYNGHTSTVSLLAKQLETLFDRIWRRIPEDDEEIVAKVITNGNRPSVPTVTKTCAPKVSTKKTPSVVVKSEPKTAAITTSATPSISTLSGVTNHHTSEANVSAAVIIPPAEMSRFNDLDSLIQMQNKMLSGLHSLTQSFVQFASMYNFPNHLLPPCSPDKHKRKKEKREKKKKSKHRHKHVTDSDSSIPCTTLEGSAIKSSPAVSTTGSTVSTGNKRHSKSIKDEESSAEDMPYEAKRQLNDAIYRLDDNGKFAVIRFLRDNEPRLRQQAGTTSEIEVDFELVRPETLRGLKKFVDKLALDASSKKSVTSSSKKRSVDVPPLVVSTSVSSVTTSSEVALPDQTVKSSTFESSEAKLITNNESMKQECTASPATSLNKEFSIKTTDEVTIHQNPPSIESSKVALSCSSSLKNSPHSSSSSDEEDGCDKGRESSKPLWGSQLFNQPKTGPSSVGSNRSNTGLKRVESEAEKREKLAAARLIQNEAKRVSQLSQKEEASRLAREKADQEHRLRQAERVKQESRQREEDARRAEVEKREAMERRKLDFMRQLEASVKAPPEPINVHELLCHFENRIDPALFQMFKI